MKIHESVLNTSIGRPRTVMVIVALAAVALAIHFPRLKVDTDPENMLAHDQTARVFHRETKKNFNLHDMIVVGVVNETDPNGVFNPHTLTRIYELSRAIETIDGVVRPDLMSLATVDNIGQGGPGVVRFEWMLPEPPADAESAAEVGRSAMRLPTIAGTLVSEDGKAAGIYVPIIEKSEGHRIASEIEAIVADYEGQEQYHITGLPVAEDRFGVEMFKQMGIAAPLAMLIIFVIMLIFFRSVALIVSPMLVAMATVIMTMGLLIGLGYTVHIMSSMIPIFLMPIAVVDSVHLLSEFADVYPTVKDKRKALQHVMGDLFRPMLYTSLTTIAGFGSLAFAPIPPVRVFGVFVAVGVAFAFILSVTFIPAYIMLMNDASIDRIRRRAEGAKKRTLLTRFLAFLGPRTLSRSKWVVATAVIVTVVSVVGISRIQINDNPVRWFRPSHPIRVADRVLNHHFGGTYNAFLVLKQTEGVGTGAVSAAVTEQLADGELAPQWQAIAEEAFALPEDGQLEHMAGAVMDLADFAETDAEANAWEDVLALIEEAQSQGKYFQSPEALSYISDLQVALLETDLVGKSTAITDIVKTVHRELREGDQRYYSIPGSQAAVAQTLLSYQSSHRPHDLYHFITPDAQQASIWVQLKSGDNQDMAAVTDRVAAYIGENPLPDGVVMDWAGLTYLNVVWQQDMVVGMLNALLGSFVIVLVMMLILFRSIWFGLLAMIPLSITIALIYGVIGLAGKDYDMPVAVLSSLALGLSVDFSIHFLFRARETQRETGDIGQTIVNMFQAPTRAITRNAIVIAVGFLPLLASPLVPYNTVGFFLAMIMATSCVVTIAVLPALLGILRKQVFRSGDGGASAAINSGGNKMKNVTTALLLAATTAIFGVVPAAAQDLTDVNEIVARANDAGYYAGADGRSLVRMTITDSQGRDRIRQFTILRKDHEDGGDQNYAVLFSRPAGVRNTVFLVKKHVGGDDDRWLYLPGLDLVKRIAAGDKRTSFVGSHFFYEDVSGRALDEDTHELTETTAEHYVIKNVPKSSSGVEFSYWVAYVDKSTFIPQRMEYFDESGELYRTIEALEVTEFQGHPTVTRMKVSDLRGGGHTISEFRRVAYDLGIPDDVFTERTLRNPSRKWFRGR